MQKLSNRNEKNKKRKSGDRSRLVFPNRRVSRRHAAVFLSSRGAARDRPSAYGRRSDFLFRVGHGGLPAQVLALRYEEQLLENEAIGSPKHSAILFKTSPAQ